MDIADRLKMLRENADLSQNKLAKISGVSQGIISSIEAGNRDPSLGVVTRLSKALGMPLSVFFDDNYDGLHSLFITDDNEIDVLREIRLLSQSDRRAVLSVIMAINSKEFRRAKTSRSKLHKRYKGSGLPTGNMISVHGLAAAGKPIFEERFEEAINVPTKYLDEDRYFVVQAKGDSMEPYILNGDYVIVQRNTMPESGEIALVRVDDSNLEEYTIKRFFRKGSMVDLRSYNPAYATLSYGIESVRSAEKVVEVISSNDA